jgi:hypothetical protein
MLPRRRGETTYRFYNISWRLHEEHGQIGRWSRSGCGGGLGYIAVDRSSGLSTLLEYMRDARVFAGIDMQMQQRDSNGLLALLSAGQYVWVLILGGAIGGNDLRGKVGRNMSQLGEGLPASRGFTSITLPCS